jgi:hydrogenase-4 component B
LFKSLLFFSAGSVLHATGTREMSRLGGLWRAMPWTAALFALGAMAVSALPPLNGFVGEWLLYLGLFRTLGLSGASGIPVAGAAAVALALIGALAVACFVKLLGTVFLGSPRGQLADQAHDPPASMIAPMVVLAVGCAAIGLFPMIATGLLEQAAKTWASVPDSTVSIAVLAPLRGVAVLGLGLVALVAVIMSVLSVLPTWRVVGAAGTWDCGYAQPTARMQYTGSSFGDTLVTLYRFIVWPRTHRPAMRGLFPRAVHFKSIVPDTVLDRIVLPVFQTAGRYVPWLRVVQQGQTQLYVLYVLVIVLVLLLWGAMGIQR